MKFCVKHRAKDGHIVEITVEAADRNGVFAELARRGISAISVTEGEAKPTRRRGSTSSKRSGSGSWCRLALPVLVVLVAVGGGLWWFMRGGAASQDEQAHKTKGLIASHTPSKAGAKDGSSGETGTGGSDVTSEAIAAGAVSNETATAASKPQKKFRVIRKDEGKKKLFHNIADIYISRVVNSQPGNLVVGTINYDRFPEQFRKALEEPITIDDDDTPEDIAKKQAVIDTRAELKQMLDDGVDIAEVMREAEAESRRLWNYRRTLHLELAKAMQEGKFNSDDMQDYVDAANMMLKDNGMEPLKYPQFWVRRMRQQEAEAALGK